MGADQAILELLATLPEAQQQGMLGLLDAIAQQGFMSASRASREQLLRTTSLANREAAGGIATLGGLSILITYAGVDPETGLNPNWPVFGFPGALSAPPDEPKRLTPLSIDGDTTLEADAVIVGSGAGGGVIAAELAKAGLRVVILEAGGYFNEADFVQSELWAYENLFWRGGPQITGDMNISIQAGGCLGGGTVVNWTNSLKTKPWVREQWAREHGLEDVGTDEWERHIDAVWERLGVNDDCSDLDVPHQLMQAGAEALGWAFKKTTRNTDPGRYTPESAGFMGFGDQSGSKNSTLRTYLQDAQDHGAQIAVNTMALKVLTEDGAATGVAATGHAAITLETGLSLVSINAGTLSDAHHATVPFQLATEQTYSTILWVRLDAPANLPPKITAAIQTSAPTTGTVTTVTLTLDNLPTVTMAEIQAAAINLVSAGEPAAKRALVHITHAANRFTANQAANALKALLQATDKLVGHTASGLAALRRQLDDLIRMTARKLAEGGTQ